jgi:hypothetical protein
MSGRGGEKSLEDSIGKCVEAIHTDEIIGLDNTIEFGVNHGITVDIHTTFYIQEIVPKEVGFVLALFETVKDVLDIGKFCERIVCEELKNFRIYEMTVFPSRRVLSDKINDIVFGFSSGCL